MSAEAGRLAGRIALITGASRGIGAAVAKRFAAEGAHVILAARTVGGLEEVDDAIRAAGGQPATLVPLDLADGEQIDSMAAAVFERFRRLDILVGNAGMLGTMTPAGHVDAKEWQRVLDVNVTANWRLIRDFDPLLRLSPAGRAIFVSSGIARHPSPYWAEYATSKAALEMLVQVWAAEVAKTPIRVNLLDPGVVRTRLRAQAYPGEDPTIHPLPETIAGAFVELAEAGCTRHGEIVAAQPPG
jgi:NAD(P)-dependent dehydrogenase (short-subunit alcohol dehydrogenase family)